MLIVLALAALLLSLLEEVFTAVLVCTNGRPLLATLCANRNMSGEVAGGKILPPPPARMLAEVSMTILFGLVLLIVGDFVVAVAFVCSLDDDEEVEAESGAAVSVGEERGWSDMA